jgi:hypothetical protein
MQKDYLPAWLLPEVRLASRPALLTLILLLVIGLGAVLAGWGNQPESPDFDLLQAPSSHKLDITSVHKPDNSVPAISSDGGLAQGPAVPSPDDVPAVLEIPAPDLTDSPGPYKVPDLPSEAANPQPPEQGPAPAPIGFDAGNLFNESSLRGDTPMIRTWKLLGYPAILAAALAAAPQLAGAQDETKNSQGSDAKRDVNLKDLKASLDAIKKQLDGNSLYTDVVAKDLRDLQAKVAQLQKDVDSLMQARTSTSNYQPTVPAPGTTTPAGRIKLVNTWPERITVFLNDRTFYVNPNQEITVPDMPAGQFTYEILDQRPDNSILQITQKLPRTLAPNETFTIHVHPR